VLIAGRVFGILSLLEGRHSMPPLVFLLLTKGFDSSMLGTGSIDRWGP